MKRCLKCQSLMPDDESRCIRCGLDSAPKPVAAAAPVKTGRIRNGWALLAQSWRVLMLDKELLVFPLFSGIACVIVLASFAGGIWASGLGEREEVVGDATAWALLFAYYFANYFVIVFFNSALVACAMIRFRGGDPTVRDGLRVARQRLAHIAAWSLLAATVGVLLRMLEQRSQLVARIMTGLLGAAWTLAAYFVVPVLVVERVGPIDALRRSFATVRKAWGESIVSNVGVGLIAFLIVLLVAVPLGVASIVLGVHMQSLTIGLTGLGLVLVFIILVALVASALNSIVLSALYLYASEHKLPQAFDAARMQAAFVAR
jgi:hypothetical protein